MSDPIVPLQPLKKERRGRPRKVKEGLAENVALTASHAAIQVDKLDRLASLMEGLYQGQQEMQKRIIALENPEIRVEKEPVQAIRTLETNLEIARKISDISNSQIDPKDQLKCSIGFHFPCDFGQRRTKTGDVNSPLTPPKTRCFLATGALKQVVDEVLTPEFKADILPDPAGQCFQLSILIPSHYGVKEDYRNGTALDVRSCVVSNIASEQQTRQWCEKVRDKIYKEHVANKIPSPFTSPIMARAQYMSPDSYSVKQVTL